MPTPKLSYEPTVELILKKGTNKWRVVGVNKTS